jgi:hypothetical protein
MSYDEPTSLSFISIGHILPKKEWVARVGMALLEKKDLDPVPISRDKF